ncbi:5-oxoprolinase subunit PxpA [Rubrobacter marinus]|uniref:5-oxoprolinase subunit PxpA n=1 Tax=Rubrobacter marinus TaxID=2653852 RepID=A0A6G8Q351_9ACTN|nr:5-oxoprolinase subunit PxpA [Rubrobacter marinus]QIN80883.1 5-oxoprolinase subunit PxpA [Rubrobacter marinus]
MQVDFNCDMGESFGPYTFGADEALMRCISSANVAGGFHAGDPTTMRKTIALAKENGVAVGVHNGYRDLVGFGRRELNVSPEEIQDELLYQLGALKEFARLYGMEVQHVKPHASLYMAAARDEDLSRAIIEVIQKVDPGLVVYCMQSSATYEVARKMDQPVAVEFFADREYNDDGQIVFTRRVTGEMDPDANAQRVLRALTENKVTTVSGNELEVFPDSVCVHSDTPGAAAIAESIVRKLDEKGIEIRPFGRAGQKIS